MLGNKNLTMWGFFLNRKVVCNLLQSTGPGGAVSVSLHWVRLQRLGVGTDLAQLVGASMDTHGVWLLCRQLPAPNSAAQGAGTAWTALLSPPSEDWNSGKQDCN